MDVMDSLRSLLVLIIVVLIVQNGETFRCWMFSSNAGCGDGCIDPFLGSADVRDVFTADCDERQLLQILPNGTEHTNKLGPGLQLFCLKLTGKMLGKVKVVIRTCASGFPNLTESSCMGSDPEKATGGNIETCEACAGDLCNWAAREGPRAAVALFVPLLLLTLT